MQADVKRFTALGELIPGRGEAVDPANHPAETFDLKQGEDLRLRFFNNNLNLQAIPALHRQNVRSGSRDDVTRFEGDSPHPVR